MTREEIKRLVLDAGEMSEQAAALAEQDKRMRGGNVVDVRAVLIANMAYTLKRLVDLVVETRHVSKGQAGE